MTLVESLARFAEPWATAYDSSKLLMNSVMFSHIGGFLVAGGLALAADRTVFRAAVAATEDRRVHLADFNAIHTPVLIGLGIAFLSGILLFLADVATFATSAVFWVKMGFLALLIANGSYLRNAGHRLGRGDELAGEWKSFRRSAAASSALWFVAVLTGVMLVNL
jgi:small-conductance mechanosensitive channel